MYREQRDNINKMIDCANVKPKMHVLETHVPEWFREWRSIGFFGEDPVESLHAVINKIQRTQSSSFAREKCKYMQTVDDEMNLHFEQFACGEEEEPKKKKRRTDGGGSSVASPAEQPSAGGK